MTLLAYPFPYGALRCRDCGLATTSLREGLVHERRSGHVMTAGNYDPEAKDNA